MSYADYPQHIEYLQRAAEGALAQHKFEALILCSGTAQARNRFDDQYWPLMPTPTYLHWCPLVEPDASQSVGLIVPDRDPPTPLAAAFLAVAESVRIVV